LYGRRVNDALSRIFAILLGEHYGEDIGVMVSDNGFVLSLQAEVDEGSITEVFSKIAKLDVTKLLKENIRRTEIDEEKIQALCSKKLMVLRNYKGQKISS